MELGVWASWARVWVFVDQVVWVTLSKDYISSIIIMEYLVGAGVVNGGRLGILTGGAIPGTI